ncbi:MAG: hypothetical protein R3A79_11000 [Nannocystaceae bacterium]
MVRRRPLVAGSFALVLVLDLACSASSGEGRTPSDAARVESPAEPESKPAPEPDLNPDIEPDPTPTIPEVDAPPAPPDVEPPPTDPLAWHRVRFAEAGLDLDVVDRPHSTRAWDAGGGVLSQRIRLKDQTEPLSLLLRAGAGVSLEEVRRDHKGAGVTASRLARGETCGRPSEHLELYVPELVIECIEYADGRPSAPGYVPPLTVVAEAFRYGDLDVVVRWTIPTALRERYRADERRFFASLTCP